MIGAIVLAAGRSTRMGGANKLLADLGGTPVIAHTVDAVVAAGLPPLVVLGHMAATVRAALVGRVAQFITAADHAAGLSRSLAAGLAAAPPDWHAALIVLGDMPAIAPATLAAIARAATSPTDVVVPVYGARRGNPVAWGRAHWRQLAAITGDHGARHLLEEVQATELIVADPGVGLDVDTAAALAALRQRLASSSSN